MSIPISIVIPYEHHPLRLPLLTFCVKSLARSAQCEVCIVETGPTAYIHDHINAFREWIRKPFRYLKVFTFHPFNRAWAFNVGVKELATFEHVLLTDADLIYPPNYQSILAQTRPPAAAWNRILYMSKEATERFLKSESLGGPYIRSTTPEKMGAAGGAMWITKTIMNHVGGMPEKDFYGKYGEDNAFWIKLEAFGYRVEAADITLHHLYHPNISTFVNPKRLIVHDMLRWPREKWRMYQRNWGYVDQNQLLT
ncbi:hypothetical protein DRO41_00275 [Candidatus Bathyarchaeota archaeon]|nr:MAG: hypothetical protein DRO41_00275 [Candidatus Bathyarchaeota archaeon]